MQSNYTLEFVEMCRMNGLKPGTLIAYFWLRCKGFNNLEVAGKMFVSRQTIQRYSQILKRMPVHEFELLRAEGSKEMNDAYVGEKENKNNLPDLTKGGGGKD